MTILSHSEEQLTEFFAFLDDLRASGQTNMFVAGPYLREEFGLTRDESHAVLKVWMTLDRAIPASERARNAIAAERGAA